MRVKVTHLKSPWPQGVVIGSIVEIPYDAIPGFLLGKCEPAPTGVAATHVYAPPRPKSVEAADDPLDGLDLGASSGGVEALEERRSQLRKRLAAIDITGADRRLEVAKAKLAGAPGDMPPVQVPGLVSELDGRRVAYEKAAAEFKAAQGSVRALREEKTAILAELEYLASLIEAESRVEVARATVSQAEDQAARCKESVASAEAALRHIESLIDKEERSYEASRDAAGARVLEAVKSGSADVPVEAATRDKIAALEVAKGGAESELQAARAALQEAEQRRREAWKQVRLAEASVAERAFLQAEREYVEALTRAMVAKSLARDPFGATDPRGEAIVRSRRIVEGLGL